jgi:hypothetical protein
VTITTEAPALPVPRTRARRLLRWAAVGGQLLQAATSFLLTLVFAHALPSADFGALVVYSLVFVLLMTIFRTVLGEQVIARPSAADVRAVGQLALLSGAAYLGVASVLVLLLGQLALLAGVLTFAGFAASDGVRYAWMALASSRDRVVLLVVDLVRAASAAGALAFASSVPILGDALAVLAGTAWLAVGLARYGFPRARPLLAFVATRGVFEVAMLTQFLIGTGVAQFLPVLALWGFGASVFGDLRLAQSIVAPVATLASAFQPAVLTLYARGAGGQDDRARMARLLALSAVACILLLPLGLAIASALVGSVLGPRGVSVAPFLVPAVVAVAGGVMSLPGGAVLRVRRLARVSFLGQMIGTVAGVGFAMAGLMAGPVGFAWALTAGALATVLASYLLLLQRLR